jgi:glycosyltransferase involved in cell wall biosynthesis
VRLTLAITTYERADALAAVLATVLRQSSPPAEVVVADDGSGDSTRAAIERFASEAPCPVHHVRQDHAGFRVARLRNLAIAHAHGDYLVFVDGDMLLDPRFIADHRHAARAGFWTQGLRLRLDAAATADVMAGATPPNALHSVAAARALRRLANTFVAVKSCNQGFWRADLVAVNGFNEEFIGWGPEDKELAARLAHLRVRRQTLLFGGIAWHLHHPPASRERRAANEAVLARTLARGLTRCAHGLDSHL